MKEPLFSISKDGTAIVEYQGDNRKKEGFPRKWALILSIERLKKCLKNAQGTRTLILSGYLQEYDKELKDLRAEEARTLKDSQ